MKLYIGVDIGTSAMKLLLDAAGNIHAAVTKEYPLEFPRPGWSQQNPEDWRSALMAGIPELLAMVAYGEYPDVKAACDRLVRVSSATQPEPALAALYEVRYRQFQKIYPAHRNLFPEIL